MDTATFITARAAIQSRMEGRRSDVASVRRAHPARLIPWALKTGLSLVAGVGGTPKAYGWMGSLAGAVVLPTLLKMFGHKPAKPQSFWQKILHTVLPL